MATPKRVTKLEMRRLALLETDQAVLEITSFTEQELADYKYEVGLQYLKATVKDPAALGYLERSKDYWNWWKNQWALRDEEGIAVVCEEGIFYQSKGGSIYREALREGYKLIHTLDVLLDTTEPESVVLTRSFNVLIGRLVELTNKPKRAA